MSKGRKRRSADARGQADRGKETEGEPGRVVAHHGVAVLVRFDTGGERQVWLAPEQRAVAGDRVVVHGDRLVVEAPYGSLRRRDMRGRERTIARNLDVLGLVVAPEPREPPGYLDRGFVIARAAGIEPMILVNKIDLDGAEPLADRLEEIYAASGPLLRVSAETGEGVDAIAETLAGGRLGALVGPSGVGKSSLLNALISDLDLEVSELNRRSQKGRHTTTTATLHSLAGGGYLVDTAGFKDFIAVDVEPTEVAAFFPGFEAALESGCRFRNCLHRSEPGCSVLAAVASGEVPERRHRAYLDLLAEIEEPARRR